MQVAAHTSYFSLHLYRGTNHPRHLKTAKQATTAITVVSINHPTTISIYFSIICHYRDVKCT